MFQKLSPVILNRSWSQAFTHVTGRRSTDALDAFSFFFKMMQGPRLSVSNKWHVKATWINASCIMGSFCYSCLFEITRNKIRCQTSHLLEQLAVFKSIQVTRLLRVHLQVHLTESAIYPFLHARKMPRTSLWSSAGKSYAISTTLVVVIEFSRDSSRRFTKTGNKEGDNKLSYCHLRHGSLACCSENVPPM